MQERTYIGTFGALPPERPFPGVDRRSFSTTLATVAQYRFEAGYEFPLHSHPQEQITLVEEGEVEFTVDGHRQALSTGDWSVVGPGIEHGLRAGPAGARVVAVVIPARQAPDAYDLSADSDG